MTIENIIQKIKAETTAEVGKILNDANSIVAEYNKDARKEMGLKLKDIRAEGEKRITIMRNIHLSEARRMTRKSILNAKEELIQQCFDQAQDRLQNLSGDEYRKIMNGLIDQSLKLVGNKGIVTLTRSEDKAIFSTMPNITVKPDIIPGLGGLIMESQDGKIVVDNTFKALIRRQKEDIRTEVAKILYPEE
jgi:V/A-type H+-transporting ATPase subunit E